MSDKEIKSGIYQIRNLVNGKIYIGSAVLLIRREKDHFRQLKKDQHPNRKLQRAWNKHGEQNFLFEIVEEVQERENLIETEQFYLEALRPEYNICKTAGSTLGLKFTEEAKQKMSESRKGEKHHFFGKHLSEEVKQKLSELRMGEKNHNFGKNLSEETKQKLSAAKKGEKHHFSKLTWEKVDEIRKKYKTGDYTQLKLACEYEVAKSTIQHIISYKIWKE